MRRWGRLAWLGGLVIGLGQPLSTRADQPASRPARILPADQTKADLEAWLLRHAPRFVASSDPVSWPAQAARLRQEILRDVILRGVPRAWTEGNVDIVWGDQLDGDGYVVRKLQYEAVPGLWIGALLYEPKNLSGKVPVVLNPNGHVGEPGMTIDYKQVRCINLAKRGMLALNPEWIGMGQLRGEGYDHGDLAYLDLCGTAGVSVFYLSLKRGLDVLLSHEAADPEHVAVTGLSGGGWQTILISALDTRVKLCAPNAGYIDLATRVRTIRDIGDLEQNPTDLLTVADYPLLTAMLYPRPALLIYNANDDCCFYAEDARRAVYEPVRPLYARAGMADLFAFHVNHDPGTHNYLRDNREAFYRFINRHFLPEEEWSDTEIPVDDEIRSADELAIDYPENNATFHTLAAGLMERLPDPTRPPAVPSGRSAPSRATTDSVCKLAGVLGYGRLPDHAIRTLADEPHATAVHAGYRRVARIIRVGNDWSLPVIEYVPSREAARTTWLVLADHGVTQARATIEELLQAGERFAYADILFTGECVPEGGAGRYAQMLSALGRRPLGIQAAQIVCLTTELSRRHPEHRVGVIAHGRVSGLAAMLAALKRGGFWRGPAALKLHGMDQSLKDVLKNRLRYDDAPSLFCFGLLAEADLPELVKLAAPIDIEFCVPK